MRIRLFILLLLGALLVHPVSAQSIAAGEAETQKCEDRIAAVQRDALNKYEDSLAELQTTLQKAADLEGAVAVRTERQRLSKDQSLAEKDLVTEPKTLRALQLQTTGKIQDLVTQLVSETVPKLVELKRQLTVAGKLDDAVAVRNSIEKLQNTWLPAFPIEAGATVTAENLVASYSGNRARADRIYKGQKFTVRGVVGGFRADPTDAKGYHIFLVGSSSGGWVQCDFSGGDTRFREEKAANVSLLVITAKDGDIVRLQKGSMFDVRGTCEGWDDLVRLTKCELSR